MLRMVSHLLLIVLLLAGSGVAAARMAPDRGDVAAAAAIAALGPVAGALCGGEGHDRPCPWCRGTPGAAAAGPDGAAERLVFTLRGGRAGDLVRGGRPVAATAGPRAPPAGRDGFAA